VLVALVDVRGWGHSVPGSKLSQTATSRDVAHPRIDEESLEGRMPCRGLDDARIS
jgi:hypothetical protein